MTNALGLLFGTIFPQLTASVIRNITYSYRYTYTFCLADPPDPLSPYQPVGFHMLLSFSLSLYGDRSDFILPHKCFLFRIFLFVFFYIFSVCFFIIFVRLMLLFWEHELRARSFFLPLICSAFPVH